MFIVCVNNALALIYYITNYATKWDVSQYRRIMSAAFVKSAYDESQIPSNTTSPDTNIGLPDKFAVRAFNRLAYDREISGPLVASSLLGLPKHYIMPCDVRSINIGLLRNCFSEIALGHYNHARDGDNFVVLRQQTDTPLSLLDHYFARGTCLQNFCLYDYVWVIIVIPHKRKQVNDFNFADNHRNGTSFMQRHITKGKPAIVKLLGCLYDNMDSNNDVSIDDSNSRNDDSAIVLLALFVP